ncbi:hypothetical protein AGMMS49579_14210 [Spirochaetia bacterium]|nr:hypothetical protein AGMMS49579_14210 [Spirochaetia bacterium]
MRLILPSVLFLLTAAVVMGFGTKDKPPTAKTKAITEQPPFYRDRNGPPEPVGEEDITADLPLVQVTGRVRLTGSGPGQELVITGADREWRIGKEDQNKLWDLQQQTVTVEGRETSEEMTFVNGVSAGTWYYLRDIRIISISKNP